MMFDKLKYIFAAKPPKLPHTTGTWVGPFLIGKLPPGEFKKDWDTDADDIWFKDDWFIGYYND